MEQSTIVDQAVNLANEAQRLAEQAGALATAATQIVPPDVAAAAGGGHFLSLFTVFVLACFVGFYVVWSVTPALHSPLMSVTNAISSIIAVGALIQVAPPIAEGTADRPDGLILGLAVLALTLTAVNMFGGFAVTRRMLAMFRK